MTITIYRSTDASAPVLSGQTGALNDLLHAILVTGYGSKSAAGWTREYNDATSKTMVWRPASGSRHYLQNQDNGPGAGTFKESRCRGYVSMSAYNTGTEPFPTSAQATNGLFIRKSATADSTARPWIAIADGATLHLGIYPGDTAGSLLWYTFGAFNSWKSSDGYGSIIQARVVENSSAQTTTQSPNGAWYTSASPTTTGYRPRSYSGTGTAVAVSQIINMALLGSAGSTFFGAAGQTYPNPVDGGILLSPIYITEGALIVGTQRGLWDPCHVAPILTDDTFSVTDGATTRDFLAQPWYSTGQMFIETSATWDTP